MPPDITKTSLPLLKAVISRLLHYEGEYSKIEYACDQANGTHFARKYSNISKGHFYSYQANSTPAQNTLRHCAREKTW